MLRNRPPADLATRLARVRDLGAAFADPAHADARVQAYVADTAFRVEDVEHREVRTPAALCALAGAGGIDLARIAERRPLGKVAVVVPRNSVGLTIAKAVVGAYLAGNEVVVRLPTQLERTLPHVEALLRTHLDGVTLAPAHLGSQAFLDASLDDREVQAVVVYGDDAWIDAYRPRAERTRTALYFEGPGKDPLVVLEGADVETAVDAAIRGGLHNGGQSCSAFERFYVHASLHDAFVDRLVARLAALRRGDPRDREVGIGPIASSRVLARIVAQLGDATARGARLVAGGTVVNDVHAGLPSLVPAVLTGCTPDMDVLRDETFGAVFPVVSFQDGESLLSVLDACRYGLNAAVIGTALGAEGGSPPPSATPPPAHGAARLLHAWLAARHRNAYLNATPFDPASLPSRMVDGGYRRSGFSWTFPDAACVVAEGPRILAHVLSRPESPA